MGRRRQPEPMIMLKGTRTAMSFVLESRRIAIADPYPAEGQPGYSSMADILARAVLFANWEVVGAAALVRAGSVTRVVEAGLTGVYRTDEFMRRLTMRMLADATHELIDTPVIEDAWRREVDIAPFIKRRRVNRAEDKAMRPEPIGALHIPLDADMQSRWARFRRSGGDTMPRAPRSVSL
ncbi:hypothetical protein [Maritimibacter sp. DP1N21-5]|uniref:hypothetical protein n=1 Tax=Maritimibacter sp. DP1N21-5 TaxID=2836867 RepID=UPI001C4865D8|nr:hypothetical protein [Maritimibacter sp. DP1N21-5]MBV7410783.1 hypothetical protein [Maritimibacter sp. DP1N21-5]